MKIMKNRFRKRLAFLLIFTILVMALSPVGCVKRADAADETNTADDVIKLYDKGQLIGKYGDLKTTFENMTDSEGEYKIIFSAEQTEYCIDGEVWLPECESIKFVGLPVGEEQYSSTAIKINDSIHMQSDVTLNNCTLYDEETNEISAVYMGSHKLTVSGKYAMIKTTDVQSELYFLKIKGDTGSEFVVDNCSYIMRCDIFVDTLRFGKNADVDFGYGIIVEINKVIVKDYPGKIIAYYNTIYSIGEVELNNAMLYISIKGNIRMNIGKVTRGLNDSMEKSYLSLCASGDYNTFALDYHPRFTISDIQDVNIEFKISLSPFNAQDTFDKTLLHNKISCLKLPKDYDIKNITKYEVSYNGSCDDYARFKDADGNVWLYMIDDTADKDDDTDDNEVICYELDEEQRDQYNIFYKLNDEEKTAIVGTDSDVRDNAGFSRKTGNVLKIPSYVKYNGVTYTVTRIGNSAFEYNQIGIGEVIIPDTVLSIGNKAFYDVLALSFCLGKNVAVIEDEALSSIGTMILKVDKDNENFVVHNNVLFDKNMTTLIRCADMEYEHYPVYYVPKTVKNIAAGAFYFIDILNINADSVISIGEEAFREARKLRTVSIKNVSEIPNKAFYDCESLRNIYMSDNLKKIGEEAFVYCYNLKSIILPNSVKNVGSCAFQSSAIENIMGAENAHYDNGAFSTCKNLSLLQMSSSMNEIPEWLFGYNGTSLKKLYLPEQYSGYGYGCFYDIPEGTITIYGKESQRSIAEENSMNFKCIDEHEHNFITKILQKSRFYEAGIEVTYCTECHYISAYKTIDAPEKFKEPVEDEEEEPVHPLEEPIPLPATSPAVTQSPAASSTPTDFITPQPSVSPTVTSFPTVSPTVSPVITKSPAPQPSKTPTVTVKPTKTPAATATVPFPSQTPIMTDSPPVVSPTAAPINSPSAMPNGNVSSKPDKEPEPTVEHQTTPTPTDITTPQPAGNASPQPTNEPSYTKSPTPATDVPTAVPGLSEKDKKALIVKINLIELTKYNQPEIVWKKTSVNIGYEIYRAISKKIAWQKIAASDNNKTYRYTDKKAKAGQKYYYRIRLFKKTGGKKYYGKYSNICMIKTLSIVKPKIKGTTGTYQKMPYVQIELKKYSGIYAEIYIRGKDKKYQKIKLKSSSIKRYKAKFKLRCDNKKAVYYFKVRTIVKKSKRRYYSVYSDGVRVKVMGH